MKSVRIENISLRTYSSGGRSHIEFTDENGESRLGRILPASTAVKYLSGIYALARSLPYIIIPDGITQMADENWCLSTTETNLFLPEKEENLRSLLKPLKSLHRKGIYHLSIDEHCFIRRKQNTDVSLVFWGDGLLSIHPDAPCEVQCGGIPGPVSDLHMLAATALRVNWLSQLQEQKNAEDLSNNSIVKRWKAATKFNYKSSANIDPLPQTPKPGVTIIERGDSRCRDLCINQLTSLAVNKGWICRVIRCATGEYGRPLPDVPLGTVTDTPGNLLKNSFASYGGIEKLLVVSDFSEKQKDFASLIREMSKLIPSGVRLVVSGVRVPEYINGNRISLSGPITEAADLPFDSIPEGAVIHSFGPSWYGPRCRISKESAGEISKPSIANKVLFNEGAWRYTSDLPFSGRNDRKAESLLKLNRYSEALQSVSHTNKALRSKILMRLGKFEEAVKLLRNGKETILLSEAYLGSGDLPEALEVLKKTSDPDALPLLGRLHNLSGSPASALLQLTKGLQSSDGENKIEIFCALRSLEMRLGMYEDALKHAEQAVYLSRRLTSIPLLVKSLQERGRTLQVSGNWKKALEDFRTAALYHDEGMLSSSRPPHIDLYVLQLKMGRISIAEETWKKVTEYLNRGTILNQQMLNMLEANRGVLLGRGELSLPKALRAVELADRHGLELYSGISTLYAGQLYIQSGDRERGINLLKRARSRGHVLGDKHLVCLSEIELLLEEESYTADKSTINEIAVELPEEQAAAQVISGMNSEKGFEVLLDLPSPLLACRLAEKCGLPSNTDLRKRVISSKNQILTQLDPQERESFKTLFKTEWNTDSEEKLSDQTASNLLGVVSNWIQNYLEDESSLSSLTELLALKEISQMKKNGMLTVPGSNSLYCSGPRAGVIAPFLEPVAAVLATKPAVKNPVVKSDRLANLIVGCSKKMERIRFEIERLASEDVPVLITGETGTGKELCAKAIHSASNQRQGKFVPVDCGAIPENLMESEFFGAEVGAYTGISKARKGLLEEANDGTLFMDEIGNLPLHMQAKLLRVLDTGVFRRLGETRERSVAIRVVAATNADIEKQIESGAFRTDLYYRISVVRIDLPPLRERLEDIPLLVPIFTRKKISKGALEVLSSYRWPGNVRELSNVLRRASIATKGTVIQKSHISFNTISTVRSGTCTLHEAIARHIRETVDSFGGSRSKAAKALKCDPKTLRKYLRE